MGLLDDNRQLRDAVVTLYVHAGIAASDVICCARLGLHATGDNHADSVALPKKAGAASHRHLATLLGLKTKDGYSHTPASAAEVKKAAWAAVPLVEDARAAPGHRLTKGRCPPISASLVTPPGLRQTCQDSIEQKTTTHITGGASELAAQADSAFSLVSDLRPPSVAWTS